jgi:UDP-glucuronate 4-epimerase
MPVLITGVAGFIGYHVASALLQRGLHVVGIDNLNSYYDPRLKESRLTALRERGGRFEFHRVDFAEHVALAEALDGAGHEIIIHLGAQAGVRYSIDNPRAYVASNLAGHLNMLELARSPDTQHFLYASSSSVYGGNERLPFSVADRADHPVSLYAATKRADELLSESYAHLYRIPMTGLRFFTVYGPWGRPDMAMWKFTDRILKGAPLVAYNDGQMRRDFTYVDDIVAGVLAAADRPPADDGREKPGGSRAPHAIYNIGNSRPEELMRVIGLLEEACGKRAQIEFAPMQPGDVPETYADLSAIERDLGFRPTTSIEQGIPRFVEWFRSYHGLASLR